MLSVEHVKFSYKKERPILQDISFELDEGECLCLLGPNGTGKTTLLKCLLNEQHPAGGRIILNDKEIRHMTARERAAQLAYVSQSSQMAFPYSVEEVVLMGRIAHMGLGAAVSDKDRRIAWEMMTRLGIEKMADENFQVLSGGERQMVLIARALAQQARYLILDEPTAALDYSNQVKILEMIQSLSKDGYGVLMTSHFPDHAFLVCDKAVLLKNGHVLAFGPPDEVVTGKNLTELYGVPVCVAETLIKNKSSQTLQKVCVPMMKKEETMK